VAALSLTWRWLRIEVRRRWRMLVVLTLAIAAVGGLVMATVAGARRGASALDRLQQGAAPATAVVFVDSPNFDWDVVRALPQVSDLTQFVVRYTVNFDGVSRRIGFAGPALDQTLSGGFVAADDALFRTTERPVVLAGRMYDPTRGDEAVVTRGFVDHVHKGIGDTLTVTLPSIAELRSGLVFSTSSALSGPHVTLHIVGVVLSPWASDVVASPGGVVLSPGFVRDHPENTIGSAVTANNPAWVDALVRLRHGAADIPAFRTDLAKATHRTDLQVWDLPARARDRQHEITFETRCLLAFGLAVLIAALFALAQAMARTAAATVAELDALHGAGLTSRQATLLATAMPTAAATAGALLAAGAAISASSLFPIATARYLEPHPGTTVDWVVIGPGVPLVILAVSLTTAVAARVAGARQRAERARGSRLVGSVTRRGLPVPVVVGTRFALESGAGRSAIPVRATLLGAVAGVLGVVAALTFSAGIQDASRNPERYGQTFQLGGFLGQSGNDFYPVARISRFVAAAPEVSAVADLRQAIATTPDGKSSVSLFAMGRSTKPLPIVATAGRTPRGPDEVLLAPRTIAAMHASVGSVIRLNGNKGSATFRVTGAGFVPHGGAEQVYAEGGWVTPEGFARVFTRFRFHFLAVSVAPGRDPARVGPALHARIASAFPGTDGLTFEHAVPPTEIFQLRQVRALPMLLGIFLAVLAIAALAHALATAVRRRAPELAVLRAVGMTPRECRLAVLTQAMLTATIGLALGVPLGLALGRTVWRSVANYTPLQYVAPSVGWLLLLCVPITLLIAALLAAIPARRAARLPVTQILRAE
jgi:FtsX-like permease family protein